MLEVTNYLQDTYNVLRHILGSKLGLLGQYEYLTKGQALNPPLRDHSISILQVIPDPKSEYRLVSESGIEAILEGESNLETTLLNNGGVIGCENYKLTLLQHKTGDYQSLDDAVRAIFSIPSIKPLDKPVYRPRLPIDSGLKGKDNSYSPAMAVITLKRNY